MSADDGGDGGPGRREVAWRLFAAEYDDADYSYSEGDQERAPNYVVTPTGARVNRLFAVGVLTAVESVSDDVVRARVVDPTGAFVVYAGQYQPEALASLERLEPPTFVAVTGKARTFQPDDSEVVYTSIRPESVNEVDADARDRWVVRTAEHTLARASAFADALDRPERGDDLTAVLEAAGVDDRLAAGVPRAIEQYGTTTGYLAALRDLALDATRVVAGDREEAGSLDLAPDEGGDADLDLSVTLDEEGEVPAVAAAPSPESAADSDAEGAVGDAGGDATAEADDSSVGGAVDDDGAGTGGDTAVASDGDSATGAVGDSSASAGVEAGESADDASAGEAATATATVDGVGDAPGDDGQGAVDADETSAVESDATDTDATDDADDADATDDAPVETDEMYELDEEERAEIEEEFPTEFSSGNDIPDAGEADIETPEPEGDAEETAATDESADGVEVESDDGADDEPTGDDADEPSGDEVPDDLESVVVEYMQELDDGDGADREALTAAVTDDYAVDAADVEEAVQDALMSGRCFEPQDGVVQPI